MKLNKPHIYFSVVALLIFIIGLFFSKSDKSFVINNYDTYYVISYYHSAIILVSIFAFIGIVFWVLNTFKTNRKS